MNEVSKKIKYIHVKQVLHNIVKGHSDLFKLNKNILHVLIPLYEPNTEGRLQRRASWVKQPLNTTTHQEATCDFILYESSMKNMT